jgi:hypothetical protein
MQRFPDSALGERNPADPAMPEADAEPASIEIQANKRRKINVFPDA